MELNHSRPQLEMNLESPVMAQSDYWIEVEGIDRWVMHRRLQELGLTCKCQCGAPLQVRIDSPQDVLLCWSVMRSAVFQAGDRLAFAAGLEDCWNLEAAQSSM
ncbi:hypothetical protein IQ266_13135 [filamentous cyanobacterium LEGE 11480]|uniref:Uncharacterized protein n=1 Tax=Romeriopsis navalis LEGE 11480 TaxID=2777977 RepID=A0A928Z2S0_9CYAN|nr:Asr1405/Asl0597 family protein [Romeriopsis navalis]MBE9030676.1 hypothetical protein [Romeriopsis navalis LEGE 11480]